MNLEDAKKIVFEKKPVFAELYWKYKDKNWLDYTKENHPQNFISNEHIPELLKVVNDILEPLIGSQKAKNATMTIQKTGFISTADHSGILCHPFFSNSALVRSEGATKNDSIVCFTCGSVSLTNSSYPRGIFFHDSNLKEIRMPFVSLKGRRRSVFGLKPFKKERIENIFSSINHLNISESSKHKLKKFFSSILDCGKIFEQKTYSEQLIILNDLLWQNLFENNRGNLIYIEAENIVRRLLLDVHLNQKTFINKIIFEKGLRKSFVENFENIVGAHNTKTHSGSHLFWYINEEKNAREQLFLNDDHLETIDQKTIIKFDVETLKKHLQNYTLIPSMAFCYGMLAFYYGLTLGGGFSQIKYLGDIKNAWKKTADIADEKIENPRTDIFTGEFVLIGISDGKIVKSASLLDALIYNSDLKTDHLAHQESVDKCVSVSIKESKIGDTIDAMMDEFVEIITGQKPTIENLKIHPKFYV